MRKPFVFFTLLIVFVGLVACTGPVSIPASSSQPVPTSVPSSAAATPPPGATRGGEYRIAVTTDAPTLHPFKRTDAASDAYIALLFTRTLWQYNPDTLEPEPWAAESWTVSEDHKTLTFKLRDMLWSDGQPVTAYDWQWTFDQAIKPENKWPYRSGSERDISSYLALDDKTLEIRLKEAKPLNIALTRVNVLVAVLPRHIWGKYDWNDPTQNPEIMQPSVVNGPYLLKEWKRDDHAIFVRNDRYFQGPANIEKVTYQIIPNSAIHLQMLLNGDVDAGTVTAGDFDKARASEKLKLYQWDSATAIWDYVGLNLRRSPLNDIAFRHALAYLTPRDLIAQKVFNGLSKPTYSTFPPTSWVYNPNVPKYDYSVETAKATLDRSGYPANANGKRLGKEGQLIRLKLLYPTSSATSAMIALILQEQFKQTGIELEVIPLEAGALLAAIKNPTYDWDLDILAWNAGIEPSDIRAIWMEAGIPDLNRGAYVNKTQEDLWEQAEKEFDAAKRQALYQQIQQIISDDSPYIFLVYRTGWTFLNQRIIPNPPTRLGINYNFAQWAIAENVK